MRKSNKKDIPQGAKQNSCHDEVDALVAQVQTAASELLELWQEDVDRIVHAMACARMLLSLNPSNRIACGSN
jgi:hypothetical protein